MVVAGGTDVYPKMKRGQFTPRHLVSLRNCASSRESGKTKMAFGSAPAKA